MKKIFALALLLGLGMLVGCDSGTTPAKTTPSGTSKGTTSTTTTSTSGSTTPPADTAKK